MGKKISTEPSFDTLLGASSLGIRRPAVSPKLLKDMTEARWRLLAQKHADKLGVVGGDSLWTSDDPYDLVSAATAAFADGQSPKNFIEEQFAEDLAVSAHDEDMYRESLEAE
jgi:hypothetical protein